jgi:hypothetical protein
MWMSQLIQFSYSFHMEKSLYHKALWTMMKSYHNEVDYNIILSSMEHDHMSTLQSTCPIRSISSCQLGRKLTSRPWPHPSLLYHFWWLGLNGISQSFQLHAGMKPTNMPWPLPCYYIMYKWFLPVPPAMSLHEKLQISHNHFLHYHIT